MNKARMCRVAGAVAALAGCSALQPYATYPRAASPGEVDAGPRVAICYNTLVSSLDDVQKTAQEECAANTLATYSGTDWHLDYCPLLLPARATFVCAPTK
jgi:hypothetical protein